MIVFGTRPRYKVVDTGQFNCPHCGKPREYQHKHGRNYFTVYFIPIFPIGEAHEFIECTTCGRSYAQDVLKFKPSKPQPDVARLLNDVRTRLERGYSLEYVIADLTSGGLDRDVAHNVVNMAIGESRKTCPQCELTYAASVTMCPDCKVPLISAG
jgi:uncharacterized protein (UPF0212 family)